MIRTLSFAARFVFSCLVVLLIGFLGAIVGLANYLGVKSAFELQGFEPRPLFTDELIGPILGALFPEATISHLFAMAVTLTISVGIFFTTRMTYQLFSGMGSSSSKSIQISSNPNPGKDSHRPTWGSAIVLLAIATLTVVAIIWDVQLFRFRLLAGAGGIESASAAVEIQSWQLVQQSLSSTYLLQLVEYGAIAYVAITAISAILFELTLQKCSVAWQELLNEISKKEETPQLNRELTWGDGLDPRDIYLSIPKLRNGVKNAVL